MNDKAGQPARGTLLRDRRYAQSPQKQWPATAAPSTRKRHGRSAGQARLSQASRDCWDALRLSPLSSDNNLGLIFWNHWEVSSVVRYAFFGRLAKTAITPPNRSNVPWRPPFATLAFSKGRKSDRARGTGQSCLRR